MPAYQKFEYAVGHWLQKATEHVLGCVLCSPGCFSLFRAKAIMDDNVMARVSLVSSRSIDEHQSIFSASLSKMILYHVTQKKLCSVRRFYLCKSKHCTTFFGSPCIPQYTTIAKQAREHLQFDQGEDRWLCTLLLQRGWRVEYSAASDSYTGTCKYIKVIQV